MSRYDVIVVGGGPAGSVAARRLALAGRSVLLVDRSRHPRRKVCGACLAGHAVEALAAEGLGHLPDRLGAGRPGRLRLRGWGVRADLRLGATRVLSRAALDAALLDAARDAGVEVIEGAVARVGELSEDHRIVVVESSGFAESHHARLVVGATGLAPLRFDRPGEAPEVRVTDGSRVGVGARFVASTFPPDLVGPDSIAMCIAEGGYVGLSSLEDGTIDVAGAVDAEWIRSCGGVAAAVSSLLQASGIPAPDPDPIDEWRGTPPLTRRAIPAGASRVLLIGDAAGYTEPFTGEGMRWAIEGARALIPFATRTLDDGWSADLLRDWTRDRRRTRGRSARLARIVAGVARRPSVAATVLRVLALRPGLAAPWIRRASGPFDLRPQLHSPTTSSIPPTRGLP